MAERARAVLLVSFLSVSWSFHLPRNPLSAFEYKLDATWPSATTQFVRSAQDFCTAVDDIRHEVYVGLRGPGIPESGPVLVFGEDGTYRRSWGHRLVDMIHGIRLQRLVNGSLRVWVTDLGNGPLGHTVKMFSSDGVLLETIGTAGQAGTSLKPIQFDQVADVAIGQNNSLYIVDGDGGMNNRLIKLDANRKVMWSVGSRGMKPSQFNIPHSVELDPRLDVVWVADRMNNRTQAFNTTDGRFLAEWTCMRPLSPYHIRLDPSGHYYIMLDLASARLLVLTAPDDIKALNICRVVSETVMHPNNTKPHAFSVSRSTGALFIGEVGANVTQKYIPCNTSNRHQAHHPDRHEMSFVCTTVFEPFMLFLVFAVVLTWILQRRMRSGGRAHYHRVQMKDGSSWHK